MGYYEMRKQAGGKHPPRKHSCSTRFRYWWVIFRLIERHTDILTINTHTTCAIKPWSDQPSPSTSTLSNSSYTPFQALLLVQLFLNNTLVNPFWLSTLPPPLTFGVNRSYHTHEWLQPHWQLNICVVWFSEMATKIKMKIKYDWLYHAFWNVSVDNRSTSECLQLT